MKHISHSDYCAFKVKFKNETRDLLDESYRNRRLFLLPIKHVYPRTRVSGVSDRGTCPLHRIAEPTGTRA